MGGGYVQMNTRSPLREGMEAPFPFPHTFISMNLSMQETRIRSLGWEDPLEKKMATHSSTLAWKLPWMEGPTGHAMIYYRYFIFSIVLVCPLINKKGFPGWCSGEESACQCRRHKRCGSGLIRVGKIFWRRKWQPTPIFLLGEFQGHRSMAGSERLFSGPGA